MKKINGAVSISIEGFSPFSASSSSSSSSSSPVLWKSRKRSAYRRNLGTETEKTNDTAPNNADESPTDEKIEDSIVLGVLSERRKALFEPLEPVINSNGRRPAAELLLPPPDFDDACYPKGWLIGKKRKLVNVDVVESMRRIAVQEMNRKDREIDGLNEQLEEDAKCLEHIQTQLLDERSKRADVERQNEMLHNQINMLQDNETMEVEEDEEGNGDET